MTEPDEVSLRFSQPILIQLSQQNWLDPSEVRVIGQKRLEAPGELKPWMLEMAKANPLPENWGWAICDEGYSGFVKDWP